MVFDDLERCLLKTSRILGYLNNFVEHQNKKLIIIANDNEIKKSNTNDEADYSLIKEKIIGKTFQIQSDIPSVIEHIINHSCQKSAETVQK